MAATAILDNFEWPYLRNGLRSTYIDRAMHGHLCDSTAFLLLVIVQESPADAGIPARRKNDEKFLHFEVITSSSQVGNPVFIVIKFLIQITSTYNNS